MRTCICYPNVAVVPVILEPSKNTTITVDQFSAAMFDCSAVGIPVPVITWLRVYENGTTKELTVDMNSHVNLSVPEESQYDLQGHGFVTQVNRTLTLARSLDGDSGTYRCVASNAAGSDMQDFQLVVQGTQNSLYLLTLTLH